MTEGTRSGLWSYMRTAIDQLRPGLVVIENVGGLFSAQANSFMEPCPYGLGDSNGGGHAVLLRAADAVLGDLASIGYDAEWVALRAADVGAPHGRLRVFITAHPAPDTSGGGSGGGAEGPAPARCHDAPVGPDPRSDRGRDHQGLTLLPTPGANLGSNGGPQHPDKRRAGGHSVSIEDAVHGLSLLPTPRATDGTKGGPNQRGSSGDLMLPSAVAQLLPTPTAQAAKHAGDDRGPGTLDDHNLWAVVTRHDRFGPYAPAIHRWEQVMGRHAPDPTEPGKTRPRLSAHFVEWLMGLPEGHVTGVPGITRNQQLKALGNGVVPLQCEAALAHLHHVRKAA